MAQQLYARHCSTVHNCQCSSETLYRDVSKAWDVQPWFCMLHCMHCMSVDEVEIKVHWRGMKLVQLNAEMLCWASVCYQHCLCQVRIGQGWKLILCPRKLFQVFFRWKWLSRYSSSEWFMRWMLLHECYNRGRLNWIKGIADTWIKVIRWNLSWSRYPVHMGKLGKLYASLHDEGLKVRLCVCMDTKMCWMVNLCIDSVFLLWPISINIIDTWFILICSVMQTPQTK